MDSINVTVNDLLQIVGQQHVELLVVRQQMEQLRTELAAERSESAERLRELRAAQQDLEGLRPRPTFPS